MSMLAETRRKKGWILNPKGSHWADDDNKFGQKMLEQMGWSRGKGLGKQMTGITEHIRPSIQSDMRGLGFEGNADDWVTHLDDFNDLLAQLQRDQSGAGASGSGAGAGRARSLEERSKKSRARVHYHKFTRGKDLSRASHSDLAAILGGRAEAGAVASQPVTPVTSRPPTPPQHADSEPEPEPEEQQQHDASSGYTTINRKLSVKDYFAEKMRKIKLARLKSQEESMDIVQSSSNTDVDMNNDFHNGTATAADTAHSEVKSKKKKKKRKEGGETCASEESQIETIVDEDIINDVGKIAIVDCQTVNNEKSAEDVKRKSKKKEKNKKISSHEKQLAGSDVSSASFRNGECTIDKTPLPGDVAEYADTSSLELDVTSPDHCESANKRKRDKHDPFGKPSLWPAQQEGRPEKRKKKKSKRDT